MLKGYKTQKGLTGCRGRELMEMAGVTTVAQVGNK